MQTGGSPESFIRGKWRLTYQYCLYFDFLGVSQSPPMVLPMVPWISPHGEGGWLELSCSHEPPPDEGPHNQPDHLIVRCEIRSEEYRKTTLQVPSHPENPTRDCGGIPSQTKLAQALLPSGDPLPKRQCLNIAHHRSRM